MQAVIRFLNAGAWAKAARRTDGPAGGPAGRPRDAIQEAALVGFETTVEEKANEVILSGATRLTHRFAAGELSKEAYKAQFAVPVEQLMTQRILSLLSD